MADRADEELMLRRAPEARRTLSGQARQTFADPERPFRKLALRPGLNAVQGGYLGKLAGVAGAKHCNRKENRDAVHAKDG
jgi:hypothetical protein